MAKQYLTPKPFNSLRVLPRRNFIRWGSKGYDCCICSNFSVTCRGNYLVMLQEGSNRFYLYYDGEVIRTNERLVEPLNNSNSVFNACDAVSDGIVLYRNGNNVYQATEGFTYYYQGQFVTSQAPISALLEGIGRDIYVGNDFFAYMRYKKPFLSTIISHREYTIYYKNELVTTIVYDGQQAEEMRDASYSAYDEQFVIAETSRTTRLIRYTIFYKNNPTPIIIEGSGSIMANGSGSMYFFVYAINTDTYILFYKGRKVYEGHYYGGLQQYREYMTFFISATEQVLFFDGIECQRADNNASIVILRDMSRDNYVNTYYVSPPFMYAYVVTSVSTNVYMNGVLQLPVSARVHEARLFDKYAYFVFNNGTFIFYEGVWYNISPTYYDPDVFRYTVRVTKTYMIVRTTSTEYRLYYNNQHIASFIHLLYTNIAFNYSYACIFSYGFTTVYYNGEVCHTSQGIYVNAVVIGDYCVLSSSDKQSVLVLYQGQVSQTYSKVTVFSMCSILDIYKESNDLPLYAVFDELGTGRYDFMLYRGELVYGTYDSTVPFYLCCPRAVVVGENDVDLRYATFDGSITAYKNIKAVFCCSFGSVIVGTENNDDSGDFDIFIFDRIYGLTKIEHAML